MKQAIVLPHKVVKKPLPCDSKVLEVCMVNGRSGVSSEKDLESAATHEKERHPFAEQMDFTENTLW